MHNTLRVIAAGVALLSASAVHAEPGSETTKFAVMRNDIQIGTNTISVNRAGAETNVQITTHINVGLAFLTLYKFDQTETEQWTAGQLVALASETDDNGKVHKVSVNNRDGRLVVDGDGQLRNADRGVFPISLWNPPTVQGGIGLNPVDGSITPVSVIDRGVDDLVVAGHTEKAHHFEIRSTFTQDVWYDPHDRLIKVETRGRDGSTIRYQLI